MLPAWINDTNTVVGLVTGIPIIVGAVLGWLARGSGPVEPAPNVYQLGQRRQRMTVMGSFRTGVLNGIIRPHIPVSTETVNIFIATIILPLEIVFYFWAGSHADSKMPIVWLLHDILFFLICGYAIFLTFMWARLVWKMDYMSRMYGDEDN